MAYTRADLETWAGLCARFLIAGGLRPEHTVHIAFGYGLFTGGFGLHYGVEKVGRGGRAGRRRATPRGRCMLIQDLAADVLVCTPSPTRSTSPRWPRARGCPPTRSALRFGHFGGEPWTEEMRVEIERELGIMAFNNYGLSEVIGPGVSGECHLPPRHAHLRRTTSWSSASIPRRSSRCRTARRASWSSPR